MRLITLALALACTLPTAAVAQTHSHPSADTISTTATIAYRDLNLNAAEGRATLDRRVRTAVRQVCGVPNDSTLASETLRLRCARQASEQARRQVEELS